MKFLNEHFKLISLSLQALILLLVFSVKVNSCQLSNDMRTTKKNTKTLNESIITREDLEQQTKDMLIKEKELDKVKDIHSYFNGTDTTKTKK
jgi:hypothetical protein